MTTNLVTITVITVKRYNFIGQINIFKIRCWVRVLVESKQSLKLKLSGLLYDLGLSMTVWFQFINFKTVLLQNSDLKGPSRLKDRSFWITVVFEGACILITVHFWEFESVAHHLDRSILNRCFYFTNLGMFLEFLELWFLIG